MAEKDPKWYSSPMEYLIAKETAKQKRKEDEAKRKAAELEARRNGTKPVSIGNITGRAKAINDAAGE
ncbi:MAG: hypothetical protein UU06_C0012G0003 [Parcubacteria group bacterium GW2011_GWB1_40_5]|nr:MAG: hypothetical protein UU06_C0012G0003 [Parcubacteria group bacterium GW2011_GWB1_40_5]OHA87015.1 MAG: hypothetical protein A2123_02140 [Candidatus Zambryskibacteria bacterium GWB1_40_5]